MTINVEAQRANTNSLWYGMKRLIATRKRFQALGRGSFELLHPVNRKVLAFTRTYQDEHILVVANLSRFVQTVELDLSPFQGMVPEEIFGRTEFPPIGESPYFLSLSPYSFYWFSLKLQPSPTQPPKPQTQLPTLVVNGKWQNVFFQRELKANLESILPDYLYTCIWFGGKTRTVQSIHIAEAIPVPYGKGSEPRSQETGESTAGKTSQQDISTHSQSATGMMILLQVDYIQGNSETYLLPLAYAEGEQAIHLLAENSGAVVTRLQVRQEGQLQEQTTNSAGVLFDAIADKDFLSSLLDAIAHNRLYKGMAGELVATATDVFSQRWLDASTLSPTVFKAEQANTLHNNTSVVYGDATGGLSLIHI